jgi:hypothetical protein
VEVEVEVMLYRPVATSHTAEPEVVADRLTITPLFPLSAKYSPSWWALGEQSVLFPTGEVTGDKVPSTGPVSRWWAAEVSVVLHLLLMPLLVEQEEQEVALAQLPVEQEGREPCSLP